MRQTSGQNDQPARGERIAKVMARAGVASRREAEVWIAAGRVAVNGAVIASPALNVGAGDRITVDGKALPARERTRLFLYHKARGLVTTHADPGGRPTIFGALPKGMPRLISVGRLDLNTEGLLLLTNDGGLARALELPATGWLRRYRVRAHGRVQQDQLDRLRGGVTIDGIRYGAIEARLDREQGSNVWLAFAIREGKNREVKNVLGHLGLAVSRLIRVSFGPFQLGDLAEGAIEEIKTRVLREQLGERLVAASGADFSAEIAERDIVPARPEFSRHAAPRARKSAVADVRDTTSRSRVNPRSVPASPESKTTGRAKSAGTVAMDSGPRAGTRDRNDKRKSSRPLQPDGKGGHAGPKRKSRRRDAERFGEPELARRERRGGWRPPAGKKR